MAEKITPFGEFCGDYLATAAGFAHWGRIFLIAAFVAAAVYALIEAYKRWKTPVTRTDGSRLVDGAITGLPIKDLADALRELVVALATAPVWLAMMAVGIFALWAAGTLVPDKCTLADSYKPVPAASK
ncbi:hypothetical protein [Sphingomonas sp. KR3-1]|uniref:hypothetical protein n=1 Tax=Sphingomonas sp. KR3-1 TaxID=3156611 RepID=UPI0032B39ADA